MPRNDASRYAALIAGIDLIVWELLPDGRVGFLNPQGCRYCGVDDDAELCGWDWLSQLHPADREQARQVFADALRTGQGFDLSLRLRRGVPDAGEHRWFQCRALAVPDTAGGVATWLCTAIDMHERRRAEDLLRLTSSRLRTALSGSPIVLFNQDLALRYTWVDNPLLGLQGDEIIGLRDVDIHERAGDALQLETLKREVIDGGVGRRTEVTVLRGGEEHWYDLSVEPLRDADGVIEGVTCAAIDVTARRRAELALRDADRRKDEFLAVLAHELRNPLGPVRNALEVLRRSGDPAVHAQAHAMMSRQVAHMVRLVDDLLDLSRITTGKMRLKTRRLDLVALLRGAAESAAPAFAESGNQLAMAMPAAPLPVEADEARIGQVIGNLLNNACKFTPRGGHVWLRAWVETGDAVVAVRDDGIGIASADLERVFEMFAQLPVADTPGGDGLGIGLHLARLLVTLHGGRIEARSDGPGRGTEFVLRLPLAASLHEAPAAGPAGAAVVPLHVLVVDDNVDAAESLAMLVGIWGHRVDVAHDGAAGLDAAMRLRPQVVVLDLGMPRMDGCEVARRIRAMPWGRAIRLVALTGWGQQTDRQRTQDAGFDAHLVKPADPALLERLLAGWCGPADPG